MRLNVLYDGRRIGQLLDQNGRHYFEYERRFLADPLPLSPEHLPAKRGVFENRDGRFLGLPGLFYDSLPDHFGMEVIRQQFRKQGNSSPTPLQILSYLGERTIGALSYEPAQGGPEQSTEVNLVEAALSARRLIEHDHGTALDPALLASGATAGGAMPKILVAMDSQSQRILSRARQIPPGMEPWLLKLDTYGNAETSKCRLEFAYAKMATDCGIRITNTRLVRDINGIDHFAIRRFDLSSKHPNQRIHTHTYAGLFQIDFRDPSLDYDDLLRRTRALTRSEVEVREQYRRIVFNILAHNRDDHAKNFSFKMDALGEWTVSPAYDLLFCENDLGGNWMLLNGKRGHIERDDFTELARLHSIPKKLNDAIIEQTQTILENWATYAKDAGLDAGYTQAIDRAIQAQRI